MSNLHSVPLRDTQRAEAPRKASALFRRGDIVRARTGFERLVGLALLAGSGAGNYLAFNNGTFRPFDLAALIAGGAALFLLTALQWFYRPHVQSDAWWFAKIAQWFAGLNWKYCASVVVGVGLTVYGTRTLMLPILTNVLNPLINSELVPIAAWVLLGVVSLIVEVIPENILVD